MGCKLFGHLSIISLCSRNRMVVPLFFCIGTLTSILALILLILSSFLHFFNWLGPRGVGYGLCRCHHPLSKRLASWRGSASLRLSPPHSSSSPRVNLCRRVVLPRV